ncbi:MAG: sulfurtransferase TusA family protein [Oscillospiraceae bacterium]
MVDARGYSCPTPVVMTQQALKAAPAELTVLVDNKTAVENVTRFAERQGYRVAVSAGEEDDFVLKLTK